MAGPATGLAESAISILTRAVELDTKAKYTESLVCYQEGIQLLLNVLKCKNFPFFTNHMYFMQYISWGPFII